MDSADCRNPLEMKDIWEEAAVRFKERTRKPLKFEPAKTLNDCIAEIEKRQSLMTKPMATATKETAKEYGIRMLHCLKLLGGVAAQGAETAFPPSSLCFNALSLLLEIPEQLRGFHDAVDGLLETLGPSLSVFKIYERIEQFNKIEPELTQAIRQLMIGFIDICALSIELRDSKKWRKFKVEAKLILFDDDSGVKGEIARFKALTEAHISVQATQTLKTVVDNHGILMTILDKASDTGQRIDDIAAGIVHIRDADNKRKAEDAQKKQITTIQDKLGVQEKALTASKETCDTLLRKCVSGTCSWFKDADEHATFQAWVERRNAEANPVFLLQGDPNTGKSVLMSCIVHHLWSMYEELSRQTPRTLIASYFFPSSTGKSDEDMRPVETALKCIAMQLAEQDSACAKKMSQKVGANTDFRDATCEDLWDLISTCLSKGTPTTHFVLLDGLGSLPDRHRDALERLLAVFGRVSLAKSSIRVMLSVRPATISVGNTLAQSWPVLDMKQNNTGDIRKYIDHVLKKMDIFQDSDEPSKRILSKIRDRLATKANGSYYKVTTALQSIEAVVLADGDESDVDRVLDEASRDEKAISKSLIEGLEETLQAKEIVELNELLAWVIFGHITFNLKQLETVLSLRFKMHSLLKLEKKLKGKYSKIFNILPGGYVEVADDIETILRKERTQSRNVDETPKFSATITITKADLTSVQSFLWSFMQKATQEHFGFQQLVDQNSVKGRIGVNEIDAHLTMVRQTFAILANPPDETNTMTPYLLAYLPQHLDVLEQATGVDALMPSEMEMIGEGLFSLFVSGDVIESHWYSCDLVSWYGDDSAIEKFRRWLRNPSVIRHLGRLDREWLGEIEADRHPNRALLAKVAKMVAWHWLRDSEWDAWTAFKWLQGLLSLSGSRQSGRDNETTTEKSAEMTVEMVSDRCRDIIGVSNPDALWYERLGETYIDIEYRLKAVDSFKSALKLRDSSPKSYAGLARALTMMGNYRDACSNMHKALEILEKEEPLNKTAIVNTHMDLAVLHSTLYENDKAITYMEKAHNLSPDDHVRFQLLKLYLQINAVLPAISLLSELAKAVDIPDEPSALDTIMKCMIIDTQAHVVKCFAVLSGMKDLFQHILQALDRSISRTVKDNQPNLTAKFLLYKGVAIYHFSQDEETIRTESGIACWNRLLQLDGPLAGQSTRSKAFRLLSAHHFEQAITSTETVAQKRHVERLEKLAKAENPYSMLAAKAYLASYHTRRGDSASARMILQGCIDSAFDLLTDENDENDENGYFLLASILLYCGDDADALSAFSALIPPPDKRNVLTWLPDFDQEPERSFSLDLVSAVEERNILFLADQVSFALDWVKERLDKEADADAVNIVSVNAYKKIQFKLQQLPMRTIKEGFVFTCDGPCNQELDFETPLYICKYCYNRGFCGPCLESLKQGTMKLPTLDGLVCSKNHDWLRLPQWDRQMYLDALGGNIRTASGLEPAASWLKKMQSKWGFRGAREE